MSDDSSTTTSASGEISQPDSNEEKVSKKFKPSLNIPVGRVFSYMSKIIGVGSKGGSAIGSSRNFIARQRFYKSKKFLAFLAIVIFAGGIFWLKGSDSGIQSTSGVGSSVVSQLPVNKRFEVPIKTQNGEETGEKLIITITNIEKTDSILIQNKPAKPKEGKTFLVINLEIQNDTKKQLKVKPVDMVRLVGNDGRNYAPDVHNNEVNAEPVSLKRTRVGYVVDESQRKFKLLIGEVRGTQETIEIEI